MRLASATKDMGGDGVGGLGDEIFEVVGDGGKLGGGGTRRRRRLAWRCARRRQRQLGASFGPTTFGRGGRVWKLVYLLRGVPGRRRTPAENRAQRRHHHCGDSALGDRRSPRREFRLPRRIGLVMGSWSRRSRTRGSRERARRARRGQRGRIFTLELAPSAEVASCAPRGCLGCDARKTMLDTVTAGEL